MVFLSPPAMPMPAATEVAVVRADAPLAPLSADCQKGSRDCFPEDRVGVVADTVIWQVVYPVALSLAVGAPLPVEV